MTLKSHIWNWFIRPEHRQEKTAAAGSPKQSITEDQSETEFQTVQVFSSTIPSGILSGGMKWRNIVQQYSADLN